MEPKKPPQWDGSFFLQLMERRLVMYNSKYAIIRKTKIVPVGHDDQMVKHFDIEECSSPFDLLGQLFIGLARFEIP